jgi:hypothetical protein
MKRFFSYISAALALLLVIVSAVPASAAVTGGGANASGGGSSGLSITPRKNYIIQPGKSVTDKLTIGNLDNTDDLTLSLKLIDFSYTDQSGTPKLMLATNAPRTAWSLKPFTTLPDSVVIPAGSTKTVNYTISIPASQGAGSYYSAIMYQAVGANGGNVALNASGVTLAFVSVPGTVREAMSLQKIGAYNSEDNGVTGKFVFIDMNEQPKMIAYTLKNNGNVFESPAGNIVIKDMFGHQVANLATNSVSSLALIGQTRLFTTCIKTLQQKIALEGGTTKDTSCTNPGLKPGRYTATLDAFYGQNGNQTHEINAVATFWYLPIWFIAAVIVILSALGFGIWWLQRKIRGAVKGTTYKSSRPKSRFRR